MLCLGFGVSEALQTQTYTTFRHSLAPKDAQGGRSWRRAVPARARVENVRAKKKARAGAMLVMQLKLLRQRVDGAGAGMFNLNLWQMARDVINREIQVCDMSKLNVRQVFCKP